MTQEQALAVLKSGANVFLTGEPGAGKTHTISRYVTYLREHAIEPALTASTGIAATHIGGMTIHSWAGIGIKDALSAYELAAIAGNERVFKRVSKAKVLVIDEVSMLEARTLDMVEAVCRSVRRNQLPFGGLQVVFVGDFFQLPPVVRDGREAVFAWGAEAWARALPVVCYLSEQYRQDDREFLSVLAAIRANDVQEGHVRLLEERAVSPDADVVNLFPRNIDVDRINDQRLAKLGGQARSFPMDSRGPRPMVEALKRSCLSPESLSLKPGAAVMFTRNNPQAGFVNGTLGTVVDFDQGRPVVRTRFGATINAEPMDWKIEDQGTVIAAVTQVPLRLAWAMTVHKSQGMSLDAAVMDLRTAFEYGQGYVALSRVRRLSGLFLLGCNQLALQVHPVAVERDLAFRADSEEIWNQFSQIPAGERARMDKAFITACGGRLEAKPGGAGSGLPAGRQGSAGKPPATSDVRRQHPKAYARWSAEEERTLIELYKGGMPVKEIAGRLARQRGGISSRLKKLGLVH